jgi:iron complex transport system substrate-binding protein
MPSRRSLLATPFLAAASHPAAGAEAWPRRVTDMVGREVTLARPPRRLVVTESALLLNLMLIHPDPVALLVGMGGDLRRIDPAAVAMLTRRFPALADVPELTQQVGQDLPIEKLIALQPDLVVMAAWQRRRASTEAALQALAASGIPVIFVDFFINPLSRALPSLQVLGEALDRRDAASAYAEFYNAQMRRVRSAIAGRPSPRVMLQAFPGLWSCCWVAGQNGAGELLAALGAQNVAQDILANPAGGNLAVEQVLMLEPEVYIGTGMARVGSGTGIQLGFGVAAEAARSSLAGVLLAPELAELPAIRQGRSFGLWNYFGGTAVNVVALQAMAGWLYPDLARELDAAATMAEINRRFAAAAWEGTFWTALF